MAIRAKIDIYGVTCLLVFAGILFACLWPFHSPTNQVTWLAHGDGVRFGRYGTMFSRGLIRPAHVSNQGGWTLEIWLRPESTWGSGTILALYNPGRPGGLSLRQSGEDLLMKIGPWNREQPAGSCELYAHDIFRGREWVFITVVSGWGGTEVYTNGKLTQSAPHFVPSPNDLKGRLVVANSPVESDSWSGELQDLAVYNREFTADKVLQHYETRTRTGRTTVSQNERVIALYVFDEHAGKVVHNHVGSGFDLYIPRRYMELRHAFLKRPWNEYHPSLSYLEDVLVNVAGFVPLGFLFYGYFSLTRRFSRPGLITIIFGFGVSLTVEVLQAYLPTRDSGMTDIITNTLGTAAGVALFRWISIICEHFADSRYSAVRSLVRLVTDDQQLAKKRLAPIDLGSK